MKASMRIAAKATMRLRSCVVLCGVLCGLQGTGHAGTRYYFSAGGSDTNDCRTVQSACRTVDKLNAISYAAGDSILLRGGDKFPGCPMLNAMNVPGLGAAEIPIVIESYGEGRATLLSNCPGYRALLTIDGISGVAVRHLILSAEGTRTAMGILIQNGVRRHNVVDGVILQDNEIMGFNTDEPSRYAAEIFVAGMTVGGNCGALNNIQVLGNRLHGIGGSSSPDDNGITGMGCGENITNVRYAGNEVYDIGGRYPALNGTSGNGIVLANVKGGEASANRVHDNGANTRTCGGPAGVWAFRSSKVVIRSNEVYRMRPLPELPPKACDWAAFDLDAGVTDSIVEYNYSHDNAGPALLAYTAEKWGPNSFRYNISENDEALMANGSGSVVVNGGGVSYVYNNTIYRSGRYEGGTPPSCFSFGWNGIFPKGTLVANNLCVNLMTDRLGRSRYLDAGKGLDLSAMTIMNNLYLGQGARVAWNWLDVEYPSIDDFRRATGKDAGSLVGDPMLVHVGAGGTCPETLGSGGPQPCPAAYQLKRGSKIVGTGANLSASPYNLDPGTSDYFGHSIAHDVGSGYNIGADGGAP
jgi:hypothetical protein